MKINLLPPAQRKQPHRHRSQIFALLALAAVIIPMAWFTYDLITTVNGLRDEQVALNNRITELASISALLDQQAALERELASVKTEPIPELVRLVPFIDELARLMPDGVFLRSLSIDTPGVSFNGEAPSHAVAADFLRALAGSEIFANPVIGGLTRGDTGYGFNIVVSYREVAP